MSLGGASPGDPVVEVGLNHVMYGVNSSSDTAFTVYDKTGVKVAGPITFASLAPSGHACKTSVSDPIILFDRLANRWFLLEDDIGSIEPGMRADLVVLDRDYFDESTVPDEALKEVRSLLTVVDGKVVHGNADAL